MMRPSSYVSLTIGLLARLTLSGCQSDAVPPGSTFIVDGGPSRADGGSVSVPQDPASRQIFEVRQATPGLLRPSLTVDGVVVTYVRRAIGQDPAGFFVQAESSGPALFVAVEPGGLSPVPTPGNVVRFSVDETESVTGQHRVVAISDYAVTQQGASVDALATDVSQRPDLIRDLDRYESELITVQGTLIGAFQFAGTGHQRIQLSTAGIADDPDLTLRVVDELVGPAGLGPTCRVTVGPTPLWRFNTVAQVSVWEPSEVSVVECNSAFAVTTALALDETTVEISFNRPVAAGSVSPSSFTLSPVAQILGAAAEANIVTLTTEELHPLTTYTVTVDGRVTDTMGNAVEQATNHATFFSPGVGMNQPSAEGQIVITEIFNNARGADAGREWLELYNPSNTATYDLLGCTIRDAERDAAAITMSVVIGPRSYSTLAFSDGAEARPGFSPTATIAAAFTLANGDDEAILECGSITIDEVRYDGGTTFPAVEGASLALDPSANDARANDDGTRWCAGRSTFGDEAFGTPNRENDPCAGSSVDAGVPDSATPDGGSEPDAGLAADAGTAPDSGVAPDSGIAPDTGVILDSGVPLDAGPSPDAGGTPEARLVINELDYDQTGDDTMDFLELFNAGSAAASLDGLAVVLVSGGNNREYGRYALSGSLDPGGYLVIAQDAVSLPNGVLRVRLTAAIQNGAPDGAALVDTVAETVIDAVSYEGDITDALIDGFANPVNLVEGPGGPPNLTDPIAGSIARFPNGTDTDARANDWTTIPSATPGFENDP